MRCIALLLLLLPSLLFSQQKITGKLIDQDTKAPVANATVYVNNTQLSTQSDADGIFGLTVPANTASLVISHVGYKKLSYNLTKPTDTLTIILEPNTKAMESITIKSGIKGDWRKWGKLFTEQFIGTGDVAKACRLLNPQAVNFSYHEDQRMLVAWAREPLLVENRALGYIVHIDLDYFNFYDAQGLFSYSVSSFFEPLKLDKEEEKETAAARLLSYRGSKMHFARSVFGGDPRKEGFHLYTFRTQENTEKARVKRLLMQNNITSIVASGKARPGDKSDSNWYYAQVLQEKDYVSIDTVAFDLSTRLRNHSADRTDLNLGSDTVLLSYSETGTQNSSNQTLRKLTKIRFKNDGRETVEYFRDTKGNKEFSLIYMQRSGVLRFTKQGLIQSDFPPVMEGFLSGRRIAYALPFDYNPDSDLNKMGVLEGIDFVVNQYFDYHKDNKEYFHTQFNKAVFFPGENIWFKIYTLNFATRQPSVSTRNMMVELIDPAGKVVSKKLLYVDEAVTHGNFALPRNMAPGTYTFRAYTNWSKNFGQPFYFTQSLTVLGGSSSATAASQKATAKPDIQFFPEGGTLVAGMQNKLAFKITSPGGYGVQAEGTLKLNGQPVQRISTNHLGMGSFKLSPDAGSAYTATFSLGADSITVTLPKTELKSVTLTADAISGDSVRVMVMASAAALGELRGQSFNIFVHRQGNGVYFGGQFGSAQSFILHRSYFPEGVAHITLFDNKNAPIADRAVFIKPATPSLAVSAKRLNDSVALTINTTLASQPVSSNLSFSVLPIGTVADDFGRNIYSRYFLEGDIKGFIEQPAHYFEGDWEKRKADMDNLLMVQGWRSYNWNRILNGRPDTTAYAFEEGFTVKAVIPGYKQPAKQKDSTSFFLFSEKNGILLESKPTASGSFLFQRLYLRDSSQVMINTSDKKWKTGLDDLVTVVEGRSFDSVAAVSKLLKPLDSAAKEEKSILSNRGELETVVVKAFIPEPKLLGDDPYVNRGDRSLKIDDKVIERYRTVLELLRAQFALIITFDKYDNVEIKMIAHAFSTAATQPALIIDGMPINDLNYLKRLNVRDLEAVSINKFGNTMLGSRGGLGSISIKTRQSPDGLLPPTPAVVKSMWVEGYATPTAYFSPAYAVSSTSRVFTKFASLHWEPVVVTDATGKKSINIPVPAELKGFKIRIEGISVNGGLLYLEREVRLDQ